MGSYVNGVYVPTVGETGWGTQLNDFLTRSGEAIVNVKAAPYGAAGNGTTDDTSAVAAAITAAGGGIVFFPPGVYKTTSTLLPHSSSVWLGAGAQSRAYGTGTGGTVIKFTGTSTAAIKFTGVDQIRMSDFQIWTSSDTAGVVGIEMTDATNEVQTNQFTNIVIRGAGTSNATGLKMWGQTTCICHNMFETLDISNYKEGIRCSGFANANVFQNVAMNTLASAIVLDKTGSDTQGGQDNLFVRVEIDGSTTTGITLNNSAARNTFLKCVEDGVTTTGLSIGSTGSNNGNTFIGCVISPNRTDSGSGNLYLSCLIGGVPTHLDIGDVSFYQETSGVLGTLSDLHVGGDFELEGDLNHDGSNVGFFGVTPVVRPAAYSVSNPSADRTYDADATSTAELADIVANILKDLTALGLLQGVSF